MKHAVERMHNVNKEIFLTISGLKQEAGSFQFDREIPSAFAIRLSILLVQVTKFGLSFVCLRFLTLRC